MDSKNVLVHHGILGQKWGVRRYQEEDGSLTNLGKERYKGKASKKMEAMTEDYLMLRYRATGNKVPTSKEIRKTAGHEDRYKTANEVFDRLESDIERKGGVSRVGDNTSAEYYKMSYRMKDLKDAGLADKKGVSLVATRHSTVPQDVTVQYRYYTDDAIEPTYYDNIKDLERAIEEQEKKEKERKEQEKQRLKEAKKQNESSSKSVEKNTNNKVNAVVNSVINAIKNLPSSVLNTAKDAVDKGKEIVSKVLNIQNKSSVKQLTQRELDDEIVKKAYGVKK